MKTKISAYQLFCAIAIVPFSSAILLNLIEEAKQDSWIAVLIYMLPAILLQILYTSLWRKYPGDTIVTYLPKIFGKFIGYSLGVLYIIYFAYIAARILRTDSVLVTINVMVQMPVIISSLVFLLVATYVVFTGMENLFRGAHILLPLVLFLVIAIWLISFATPKIIKFYNLKPVLEEGIISVIKKGWTAISFPYGETILFAMFYPSVVESSKVRKAAILATILTGILVVSHEVWHTAILGVDVAGNFLFPFYEAVRTLRIGETLDRLDIIAIIFMVIGGIAKIAFYMYGAMLGAAQLLKIKDTKYLAIPFGIVILISSQLIAKNYPQHININNNFVLKYLHPTFQIIIPIAALLVHYIRNGGKSNSNNK